MKIFLKILALSLCLLTMNKMVLAQQNKPEYNSRIAVVDIESVMEHSLAIAHIKKTMNEITSDAQKEISKQEKKFKELEQVLLNEKGKIDEKTFEAKVQAFNKEVSLMQKNVKIKRVAIEKAHDEAIEIVHKKLMQVITDTAKKYDINLVLPSSQVLFVQNNFNITFEVIVALNNALKEVPINYH